MPHFRHSLATALLSVVGLLSSVTTSAQGAADFVMPRHRAYEWSRLSLDDFKGEIRIPVIFVGFSEANGDNETAISGANQKTWLTRLNTSNSANHMGADGSVNDYFLAQSYGAANVTFEAVGTYTASGNAAKYASKCGGMTRLAIASITDVDWSRFDCNGDGEVDCVLLVYAGHADGDDNASRQPVTSIYPHQDWLSQTTGSRLKMGSHYAQSYVWINDLRNGSSTSVDATNVACHELTHGIFDLPDYYKNLTSFMGPYDAMCFGFRQTAYGSATNHCCDLGAFSRMYLGWITPVVLTAPAHVKLNALAQHPEACIIVDPADANHFFVLENRQALADTWDAHLPASGLIVTEVHFRQSNFDFHQLNSSAVKDVQLICAADATGVAYPNASYDAFDKTRIPYGIEGRNTIGPEVSPVFAQQTVTNIRTMRDGSIEFDFMGGGTSVDFTGLRAVAADSPSASVVYSLLGRRSATASPVTIEGGRKTLHVGVR